MAFLAAFLTSGSVLAAQEPPEVAALVKRLEKAVIAKKEQLTVYGQTSSKKSKTKNTKTSFKKKKVHGTPRPDRVLAAPGPESFWRLADCIWRAEGGHRTRRPYGIKLASGRFLSRNEARLICLRIIRAEFARYHADVYQASGRVDFISFLARRYCPLEADPKGHVAWIKNVRYFWFSGFRLS